MSQHVYREPPTAFFFCLNYSKAFSIKQAVIKHKLNNGRATSPNRFYYSIIVQIVIFYCSLPFVLLFSTDYSITLFKTMFDFLGEWLNRRYKSRITPPIGIKLWETSTFVNERSSKHILMIKTVIYFHSLNYYIILKFPI